MEVEKVVFGRAEERRSLTQGPSRPKVRASPCGGRTAPGLGWRFSCGVRRPSAASTDACRSNALSRCTKSTARRKRSSMRRRRIRTQSRAPAHYDASRPWDTRRTPPSRPVRIENSGRWPQRSNGPFDRNTLGAIFRVPKPPRPYRLPTPCEISGHARFPAACKRMDADPR